MKARNRKGQVALEFLVYAGVFLLIAVAAYALTYFSQRTEVSLRESQMFREFGYKFQYAGIVAYRGGPGFTYDLYFQPAMDGKPYDLIFGRSSDDSRKAVVKTVWNGTSAEFAYLYTIPLANYVRGEGGCFKDVREGVSIDATKANGHLLFVNEGTGGDVPTITIHCGG